MGGDPNFAFHGEGDRSHGFNEFQQAHGLKNNDSCMQMYKLGLFQGFLAGELERRTQTKDLTVAALLVTGTQPSASLPATRPQGAQALGHQMGRVATPALQAALELGTERGRKMYERATGLDNPEFGKVRKMLSGADSAAVDQALEASKAAAKIAPAQPGDSRASDNFPSLG